MIKVYQIFPHFVQKINSGKNKIDLAYFVKITYLFEFIEQIILICKLDSKSNNYPSKSHFSHLFPYDLNCLLIKNKERQKVSEVRKH